MSTLSRKPLESVFGSFGIAGSRVGNNTFLGTKSTKQLCLGEKQLILLYFRHFFVQKH